MTRSALVELIAPLPSESSVAEGNVVVLLGAMAADSVCRGVPRADPARNADSFAPFARLRSTFPQVMES
jgi:hypothetical protein